MFLAFWGPMPGSARRYFSSWRAMAAASSPTGAASARAATMRPDVLHGDELLEELLVELGGEADQHRPRLVARGVVVDDQRAARRPVAAVGLDVLERAHARSGAGTPRSRCPPHSRTTRSSSLRAAQRARVSVGDHAAAASPRAATGPVQAERERVGHVARGAAVSASPSRRCTPRWICALRRRAVGGDRALHLGGRQRHAPARRTGARPGRSRRGRGPSAAPCGGTCTRRRGPRGRAASGACFEQHAATPS